MDCRYEVVLDNPVTRAMMADIVTLTGRMRNLSGTAWQIGSGPGRWNVAAYITRVGRRKHWVHQMRTSPPDSVVPTNGELEFALTIDTRGLPAGIYEVWIDLLQDRLNWMALHGAVPGTATLRIEAFNHDIAVNTETVTLPPGGTAVLQGTLRNPGGKPWPDIDGGEPLRLGARLFRRSAKDQAVREFRAGLDHLPQSADDEVYFSLVFDPGELERGEYDLAIDIVKEYRFWMSEKGATPKIVPVVIA
jgi:hypothetical protein